MSHIEDRTGLPIGALVPAPQLAVGIGIMLAGAALALGGLA